MDDLGNVLTDKELTKLENLIKKEYRQAVLEIQNKFDDYMKKYAEQDAKKAQEVKDGKITFGQYRLWRKDKILRNKHYEELRNKLVNDLLNADKKAVSYINDTLPNIYATNINYETYNAEKETLIDTSFTLYNEDTVRKLIKENPQLLPIKPNLNIPKDLLWNKRHINSAITQGILQGEGIPKIAKRLERAANMDKSVAIRNARTCVTSAQNAGRLDAMKRERDMGIAIKKVWLATLDSRTRDSHVALDGEERELEEKFSNGLIAPANDGGVGKPEECYNCRCRLGRQFDKYKTDWTNLDNRRHEKLGNMSYEQWKEEHRKHAEEVTKRREKKIQTKAQVDDISPTDKITASLSIEENGLKISNLPTESQELIASAVEKCVKKCPQLVGHLTKIEYKAEMGDALASSESLTGKINISDAFKDFEKLKADYEYNVKIGFNPEGTSVENVIIHELGHQIDGLMTKQGLYDATVNQYGIIRTSQRVQKEVLEKLGYFEYAQQQRQYWYDKGYRKRDLSEMMEAEKTEFIQDNLSRYASRNSNEFFAECFSEYMTSKNPRPAAKAFGGILEKLLGELK